MSEVEITPGKATGFVIEGMELRDYFAAQIAVGLIAGRLAGSELPIISSAYGLADEMLDYRRKTRKNCSHTWVRYHAPGDDELERVVWCKDCGVHKKEAKEKRHDS